MRHFLFLLSFICCAACCFSQATPKVKKIKPGDKASETIYYYKDNTTTATYELPNKAFTLMYRFGDVNGVKDNYDSLYKVVNHIYRLNRYFGPRRKPSRLTCYIYVKEVDAEAIALKNRIAEWTAAIGDSLVKTERAGFNFNRPWQFLFLKDTELKSSSILTAEKLSVVASDGTLWYSSPVQAFKFNGREGSVKGKLLTEKQGKKIPVPNAVVSLLRMGSEEPDTAVTDAYGDFELGVPDGKSEYNIIVKSHAADVENIILATQSGQEISRLKKTNRGFEYKLIPNDIVLLTEKENEDITLLFNRFGGSKQTDLKVTENILYALGQYKIEDAGSKKILDKVVKILKDNPKVTLQVISHTDSQGDDESNMALSEKRSASVLSYFVAKGINKARLKAIGKGETELRNRCDNAADCSDMEHEFNRRTEFKFTKS